MRIVLIGETGQVARAVQARAGEGLVVLGRAAADLSEPEGAAAALASVIGGAGAVINAAAWTAVDRAEADEAGALAVNGTAPARLAEVAAAAGVPFLHISTDYVFDGSGDAPRAVTDPVAPLNAYGRTKAAGEAGVRAAGGAHAILRTSWVFSAEGTNFIKTMLRLSETRDHLTVVADQVGGPTPAAAIAEALLTMAGAFARGAGVSGTYHFAGAPAVSWAGFARAIFEEAGRKVTVEDVPSTGFPTPARRPLNSRLDGSALEAAFGIAPPDWRTGLRAVLRDLGAL
jgi:dTDP-4-dehydrorhamnose reductase